MFIKKFIFAPLFLLFFALFLIKLQSFSQIDLIFSLNRQVLIELLTLTGLLTLSSLFYAIFIALADDWRMVLPVGFVAATLPVIILEQNFSFVIALGVIFASGIAFLQLSRKLKNYLTFEADQLLTPGVKSFATLVILFVSLAYYFSASSDISKKGFEIPDSLIEASLKFAPQPDQSLTPEQSSMLDTKIDPEEIAYLKQNPKLIKQYGLDPKILDNPNLLEPLKNPASDISKELTKSLLKDQFNQAIAPYILWVPGILAVLNFVTLNSFVYLFLLFAPLTLWLIFYLFEKLGFIGYKKEMREVKKMVV
ncbi:hypothetical protein HYS97_03535 [Candidatus Daviesbacteria bacterium]|nr:hypothetical protein [Candidatus Daviesbacteria bacterium]